jgi:hypothetical protein
MEAVRIFPCVLRMADGPDQYSRTGESNRIDPNADFVEQLAAGHPVAPHHSDGAGTQAIEAGRAWDMIAIGSALRDRYFVGALAAFAPSAP